MTFFYLTRFLVSELLLQKLNLKLDAVLRLQNKFAFVTSTLVPSTRQLANRTKESIRPILASAAQRLLANAIKVRV